MKTESNLTNADLHRLYDAALDRNDTTMATIAVRARNVEDRVARQVCAGVYNTWRVK
jgi:hypothetical protein